MRLYEYAVGLALGAAVAISGCGDDGGGGGPMDSGTTDASAIDVCADPFDFPTGDADGHAEPLAVGAGEARAGRLEQAELPPDPDGLSVVDPGDFVMANEHIAVVIEDAGPSDLFDEWGGKPVGLGRVEGGAIVDPVDFNELIMSIGQFTLEADSVTVMDDGSDGGPARVRAVGTLQLVGSLGQLIDLASVFSNPAFEGMKAAFDYELAAGAKHVDVTVRIVNTESMDLPTTSLHLFFQESRMPLYAEGPGFAFSSPQQSRLMAYADKDATNYAWEVAPELEQGFTFFLRQSGATVFQYPQFEMTGCRINAQQLGRLHVGGPGLDGLLQTVAETRGESQREITGTVTNSDGTAAEGVSVHVTYQDGGETQYLTRTTTGTDGTYSVHVPSDLTVELETWRQGDAPAGPVTAGPSDATVDFQLDPVGFIQVTAQDLASTPLPVRVQIIPDGSPAYVEPPASFGEPPVVGNRLHVVFPTDGQTTLRVPPGTHRVVVSRGYEYTMYDNDHTVTAGETETVNPVLERVVDSTGYMCADFHIHTFRSPDAGDPKDFKIRSSIGDGLEIPVLSDHRFVGDFEETIQQMGLATGQNIGQWAYGVSSLELTTFVWGHMGVFPLEPQPDQLNGGFIDWVGIEPPAAFAEARTRPSGAPGVDPAIIINHGRDFGGAALGEYFSAVGYNPATGTIGNPEMWDEQFRLIEVFNNRSFDGMTDTTGMPTDTLRDWFSFLNHFPDRTFFAVGSSDSHNVQGGSPVGYPRTCLYVDPVDTPEGLRTMGGAALVRDVAMSGDMTVSGGVLVTATATDGTRMGDTVTGAGTSETIRVRVEAPCWVDVDRLEVWLNGQVPDAIDPNQVIDLSGTNGGNCMDPVRFDADVTVNDIPATGRSWVVFQAAGDTTLGPVHPGRLPFGATNPIFFMP